MARKWIAERLEMGTSERSPMHSDCEAINVPLFIPDPSVNQITVAPTSCLAPLKDSKSRRCACNDRSSVRE